jgi:hypothetical protein
MTPHTHHLMSAQQPTPNDPMPNDPAAHDGTAGSDSGEGVTTVKRSTRRAERRRAWDQMSEIDRAVLLEAVRQRREDQEQRRAVMAGLTASRHTR